mgnify:CR=1 FL=1
MASEVLVVLPDQQNLRKTVTRERFWTIKELHDILQRFCITLTGDNFLLYDSWSFQWEDSHLWYEKQYTKIIEKDWESQCPRKMFQSFSRPMEIILSKIRMYKRRMWMLTDIKCDLVKGVARNWLFIDLIGKIVARNWHNFIQSKLKSKVITYIIDS